MMSVSAYGRLTHVVLHTCTLYDSGITALIENSPNLLTFHIFTDYILKDWILNVRSSETITTEDMTEMVKRRYFNRNLFTCGSFNISEVPPEYMGFHMDNLLVECNTDLLSLWCTMDISTFCRPLYNASSL